MNEEIPRWQYRFRNYSRAMSLLREAVEQNAEQPLSSLGQEDLIKRFEYAMELAWKLMRDYLESENVVIDCITPRTVVRRAFEANIIEDGDAWMRALDARSKVARTYNPRIFEEVMADIQSEYLKLLEELYFFMMEKELVL